ncbi:MAG TPA: thermonuclease family protein [Gammaproteobacteria bacterium]|nr:thermonuclease family protein [Gammaproteobacteria bacterium]
MKTSKPFLILFLWIFVIATLHAAELYKVISVTDGDTLKILVNDKPEKIRLLYIDAPELGQPYGKKAKQALSDKIYFKYVQIKREGRDQFGRTLGIIYVDQENINLSMIEDGHAWVYRYYKADPLFLVAEKAARFHKRGLWSLPKEQRQPPWVWRKNAWKKRK